jgi:hypothetical protein
MSWLDLCPYPCCRGDGPKYTLSLLFLSTSLALGDGRLFCSQRLLHITCFELLPLWKKRKKERNSKVFSKCFSLSFQSELSETTFYLK